jgi:hypothetical protein
MAKHVKAQKQKHVPQRTCIACRETGGKRGLIRLVRTDDGVVVDPSGKMPGRGAYLHRSVECWRIALEGNRIQQALRTKLSAANRQALAEYADELEVGDTEKETVDGSLR